jgi:glycerophosphoryl diester phosphodiesterase
VSEARQVQIIAHRGACGYLPEHTLPAKALAYGQGADFIEQDVVASRDDQLIVMHDVVLDTVTNVATVFPGREREDGRFYVRDFDLAELKSLVVHERRQAASNLPVFPGRFPTDSGDFRIPTLIEEIELVQGLNKSTGRSVGIYPEIKAPAWHRDNGIDVAAQILDVLDNYGYRGKDDAVYLQCFDAREVGRLRNELGCKVRLVQLIAENSWNESRTDYDHLKTAEGLREIAAIADAIGPWTSQLYRLAQIDGHPVSTGLASAAKAVGLDVPPYTFRADELGAGFETFDEMIRWFVAELSIDGLFTDFPDLARAALV